MSPEEEKIELLAYMQVIINYLDVKEELISSEDKIYNLLSEAIKKHNKDYDLWSVIRLMKPI